MLTALALISASPAPSRAETLSLEQCRALAVANNKQMRIKDQRVKAAQYQKKEAFAAYLPAIDFAGGYLYNQKNLSVFDSDQLLPTKTFDPSTGTYQYNLVTDPSTGVPVKGPDGQYIPSTVALIPKDALTFDIHNLFFGAVTLTQPIYMGGKIAALNKMAGYAEDIARELRDNQAEELIYAVDAAYWQVVSLRAKQRLAQSYVALLDSLDANVKAMLNEGVATRSDLLSVDVKLNQAQVDLVKVDNGLSLSRMALAQLCGLPVHQPTTLKDEDTDPATAADTGRLPAADVDMADVYASRHDVRALELATKVASQKSKVALSAMLPSLALVGSYSFSNPNMFNGYSKSLSGMFQVGAVLSVPLWHWGGDLSKYRQARVEETISALTLDDTKEKIDLQVSQATFKAQEAVRTLLMTRANLAKADENLRSANAGFREGVMTADNVMEAQTAWLKANSENIDALIDLRLCDTYLSKVTGRLTY